MKLLTLTLLLTLSLLPGCMTTSDTSKELAGTVINATQTLQQRHIETIDAYIKSIEAAKADTASLLHIIRRDKDSLSALKQQILTLRVDAMIAQAMTRYDDQAHETVFKQLDQNIEDHYWPTIVQKQAQIRARADALGLQINAHICTTEPANCSPVPLANYQALVDQYRQYSVQAELILHYGYRGETELWQSATALYEQERQAIKLKAAGFIAGQPQNLAISNQDLSAQLTEIEQNMDRLIAQLKKEREDILINWATTNGALELLRRDMNKPSELALVLNGATAQAKSILVGYSSSVNDAVSGLFGPAAGQIAGSLYESKMHEIADSGAQKLQAGLNKLLTTTATQLGTKVDQLNAQ